MWKAVLSIHLDFFLFTPSRARILDSSKDANRGDGPRFNCNPFRSILHIMSLITGLGSKKNVFTCGGGSGGTTKGIQRIFFGTSPPLGVSPLVPAEHAQSA